MDGKSLLKTYMANDVEISEASYAILSHMHLDHIGSLALLNPHTTLLVNGGNFARGRDFWFTPMTAENGVIDKNETFLGKEREISTGSEIFQFISYFSIDFLMACKCFHFANLRI